MIRVLRGIVCVNNAHLGYLWVVPWIMTEYQKEAKEKRIKEP